MVVAEIADSDTIADRRREWLRAARLYLVCEARPGGRDPEELLRPALKAGVDVVQLREKHADDGDIVRAGRVFRRLCDAYDALFIVNDRPEVAMACAADGVHVGQDDAPPAEVRRMVGEDALIGLSTHSAEQVDAASAIAVPGVDYFCVGPVYATPTKPDYEPVGLDLVRYASGQATVPWFAIGGIDPGNVGDVVGAGAERVVVVRAIRDAADPGAAARALRQGIDAALHAGARG
jgi:thiamine-phosphate pyrophosphorylase